MRTLAACPDQITPFSHRSPVADPKKQQGLIAIIFDLTLRCVLVFLVLEGAMGVFLVGRNLYKYTQAQALGAGSLDFDAELGWVGKPGREVLDAFGKNKDIRVNSQGFRADNDFSEKVPAGKTRILFSGDSFTWADGVGNGYGWTDLIGRRDPSLEIMNIAQNGYGADQAFLRYRRESERFEHDVHVFAFIGMDFERMLDDQFFGMAKPLLAHGPDGLIIKNQPLPELSRTRTWLAVAPRYFLKFHIFEVMMEFYIRQLATGPIANQTLYPDGELKTLIFAMFDELAAAAREKNTQLVVIYLPTSLDYQPSDGLKAWRTEMRAAMDARKIHYVDLIESFRKSTPNEANSLFIQQNPEGSLFHAGHYSEAGYEHFAEIIYDKLCRMPDVAKHFRACAP